MDSNKLLKILAMIGVSVGAFILAQKSKISEADEPREYFERYDGLFRLHALLNGLPDWRWLKAISKQESDLGRDPRTSNGEISSDGFSYGIMQIAPGKGSNQEMQLKGFGDKDLKEMSIPEQLYVKSKLNDPNFSIKKGAELVSYLFRKYGDAEKVFLAYNQGEKNTDNGKNYTHPNGQYANKIFDHLDWIKRQEQKYMEV